jgi:RNA polymerase sigma-70 factor (ECF subfamily)
MTASDQLAASFEGERSRLRGVAYRMLGSLAEADDAVQEAWLRYSRTASVDGTAASGIDNPAAWLTTVVSRICLDLLRARAARREDPLGPSHAPAERADGAAADPAEEAALADAVGLALLVVLDRLGPAERVAFVLHDLFAVPFDRIAPIVDRSPVAAKKLASRARGRIHGAPDDGTPAGDTGRRRAVAAAFLTASREGDPRALLALLDPDVVRRADRLVLPAGVPPVLRGARPVAEETRTNQARARVADLVLVDGSIGFAVAPHGHLVAVLALTIDGDLVTAIDVVAEPARLAALSLAVPPPPAG